MKTIFKGINKLNEECGELIQVIGKLHAYPDGEHPDGNGHLYTRLEEEIADVLAAIAYILQSEVKLDQYKIEDRMENKFNTFLSWNMSGINVEGGE